MARVVLAERRTGIELIWQRAAWPRMRRCCSIVGRLKNDALRHRGKTYPMTSTVCRDQSSNGRNVARILLAGSARQRGDTRALPFAFRLTVGYRCKRSICT